MRGVLAKKQAGLISPKNSITIKNIETMVHEFMNTDTDNQTPFNMAALHKGKPLKSTTQHRHHLIAVRRLNVAECLYSQWQKYEEKKNLR